MLSLFLAALVGAAPAAAPPGERARILSYDRDCNAGLARTATYTPADYRRLGELPRGLRQLAVDKRVAGCSVTVLPQRDETGQHMMLMRDAPARLSPIPAGRR